MDTSMGMSVDTRSQDELEVLALYRQWLDGWNRRNADAMTAVCDDDTEIIGFDGSLMVGRTEVATTLRRLFTDHKTAPYTVKVKHVHFPKPDVALMRAAAGMVPPGKLELDPALNAWHTLVAINRNGMWRVVLFQNTPAQFHGRPELVQQMTAELKRAMSEP